MIEIKDVISTRRVRRIIGMSSKSVIIIDGGRSGGIRRIRKVRMMSE